MSFSTFIKSALQCTRASFSLTRFYLATLICYTDLLVCRVFLLTVLTSNVSHVFSTFFNSRRASFSISSLDKKIWLSYTGASSHLTAEMCQWKSAIGFFAICFYFQCDGAFIVGFHSETIYWIVINWAFTDPEPISLIHIIYIFRVTWRRNSGKAALLDCCPAELDISDVACGC